MSYGSQRRNRPEILFQYEETGQNESDYVALVWIHNGRIVLDQFDCPVFDWPEVPATLSSKVEGWLQEFICRTYHRFSIKDFVARMIPGTYGISAINMRRSRFRLKAGCLAWKPRQGSKHIKAYLDELLPNHCKIANSTKEFRDLSAVEITKLKVVGKGKYPEQAGSRALNEAQREKVDKSFHGNIEITREKQVMTDKTLLGEKRDPKNVESSSVNTDSQEPKGQEPSIDKPAYLGGNCDNTGPQGGQTRATDLQRQQTAVVAARYRYMGINPDPGMNNHVRFYERDYRNVYPTSLYAEMAISRALEPARKQFWYWTGMNAPPTQRKDTYGSQWGAIQLLFDDFWLGAGFGSPIPILMMVGVWFGGFAERPVIPAPVNNLSSLRFPL